MKTLQIPDVLVRVAKLESAQLEGEGTTLQEVVEDVCLRHPVLSAHLLYDNHDLKEHFLYICSGELFAPDETLPSDSRIQMMMATSGGIDVDTLSNDEVRRYVRHITLPGVGRSGQLNLKKARVLIIGTGGLGSPISLYLAAAGVGTLGLVDFDTVESSNLQRQIVHGNSTIGMLKVDSAKQRLTDLNPHIEINTHNAAITADNALTLIYDYDLVIDGTDNFATRYVVNDACVRLEKPLIFGAIYRFEGQMSVLNHNGGPCYRCLFPKAPPAELSPNCSSGGVIGVLPGVVGMIQATEAIKVIMGIGQPLVGRLLCFDALAMSFNEVSFKRRDNCASCSAQGRQTPLQAPAAQACSDQPGAGLSSDFYIHATQLRQVMDRAASHHVLLDVRDANELEVCKLPGALNIPLNHLQDQLSTLDKDDTHYVICYAGTRAERAAHTLLSAGFTNTFVLQGGMKGWAREVEPDMPLY